MRVHLQVMVLANDKSSQRLGDNNPVSRGRDPFVCSEVENTTDNYISSCYESLSVHSLQEGLDELAFRLLFNPRSLIPRLSIFYA